MRKTLVLSNPYMRGKVVRDAQYQLKHNRFKVDFRPGERDGVFGEATAQASKRAKYYLGYPKRLIHPTYGPILNNYLRGPEKGGKRLPRLYKARMVYRQQIARRQQDKRIGVVNTAKFAAAREPIIHYTQSALRMQGVRDRIKPPRVPNWEDCSSFVTWLYWVAGAPDPNGLNYSGYGYTGTLVRHGRPISVVQLRPGDLVFYGGSYWVPHHVAVYVGGGQVISHGTESGPKWASANYRPINHCRSYLP